MIIEYPNNLGEFIGNKNTVHIFQMLASNFTKGRPIPHILLYGRPGLGKTTLIKLLAKECNLKLFSFNGEQFDLEKYNYFLANLSEDSMLFLDEIHSIERNIQERLFHILQDRRASFFHEELGEEITKIVPHFPVVGATTDPEKLLKPMRDRFQYNQILTHYKPRELVKILVQLNKTFGKDLGAEIEKTTVPYFLNVAQGTPRLLKLFYFKVLDYLFHTQTKRINQELVLTIMEMNHISPEGYDLYQQEYLTYLKNQKKPVGINNLSASLGIPMKTIETIVEPYLLQQGIVLRTPRGRILK